MATYKGFSFKNWDRNKSFILTDVELVKQDIRNHLFTKRGSRVGQGNFGTDLYDLLFEPFDQNTVVRVVDQVREVINFDPRVVLLSENDFQVIADFDNSSLTILARLFFLELQVSEVLDINLTFNR